MANSLYSIFSNDDIKKINEWDDIQREKMPKDEFGNLVIGAIGGYLTYEFTPTSLGHIVKIYNSVTKERLDLTDYSSW